MKNRIKSLVTEPPPGHYTVGDLAYLPGTIWHDDKVGVYLLFGGLQQGYQLTNMHDGTVYQSATNASGYEAMVMTLNEPHITRFRGTLELRVP